MARASKSRTRPAQPAATADYAKVMGFARLRIVLDAFEVMALRSYANAKSGSVREEVLKAVEASVRSCKVPGGVFFGRCPGDLYDCGGYCVPYPCMLAAE